MIIFDAGLYLYRMLLWELPWVGGRARGHQRPRAPSLAERAEEQRRALGLKGVESDMSDGGRGMETGELGESVSERGKDTKKENMAATTDGRAHPTAEGGAKRRTSGRT